MKTYIATACLLAAVSMILSGCGGGSKQDPFSDNNVSGSVTVTPSDSILLANTERVAVARPGSTLSIWVTVHPNLGVEGSTVAETSPPKISIWKMNSIVDQKPNNSFGWVDAIVADNSNMPSGTHAWKVVYALDNGPETGLYAVLVSVTSTSGTQVNKLLGQFYATH